MNITFAQQSEKWLENGITRKRRPFRVHTVKTYRAALKKVLPLIGRLPLEIIENGEVKKVGAKLTGLSPATVKLYVDVIKEVVDSAVDSNGNALYPRKWNGEFLDLPVVETQKTPTVTPEEIEEAIRRAIQAGRIGDAALYALLAGTGLRISEALAVMIGKDDGKGSFWVPESGILIIRQQRIVNAFTDTKTKAGVREVNLAPELNDFLKPVFSNFATVTGLLFPESESEYRTRLKEDGVDGGFHSMRRFRETFLEKQGTIRMMMKFWTGHAAEDISERYIKFGPEIEARKQWAAKIGLGFKLPEIV